MRSRRTPEEARALILTAARKLLSEKGPDAVGLKDIAREAGVSHALVSHYFGTYDALVEAALARHLADNRADLIARLASSTDQGPEAWVAHCFATMGTPMYGRLLAWALLSGRLDSEDFFPRKDRGMKQVADALEAYFAGQGKKADRDAIEFGMLLVVSTVLGYQLARGPLWAALGKEPKDTWFMKRLGRLIARETKRRVK
jgi:AcrR family transcriptional regulator